MDEVDSPGKAIKADLRKTNYSGKGSMNRKNTFRLMMKIGVFLLLSGCLSLGPAKRSGFLVNYSSFKPVPNFPNVLFYKNPGLSLDQIGEQYSAFMIDPIAVYFHPDVIGRAVKPDDLKDLTDYFQRELAIVLNKQFHVVDTPGPDVARIRIAVTNVSASNFRLTIHPTLAAVDLEHAAMELEVIDSKTAGRIMALIDLRSRGTITKFDDLTIKKYSHAVIDAWIKEIPERMSAVFKAPEPPPEPTTEPPSSPVNKNVGTDQS
jgi:hypothetical protein